MATRIGQLWQEQMVQNIVQFNMNLALKNFPLINFFNPWQSFGKELLTEKEYQYETDFCNLIAVLPQFTGSSWFIHIVF